MRDRSSWVSRQDERTRGVSQNGGTYGAAWNDAEQRTCQLNSGRDRDQDGDACEQPGACSTQYPPTDKRPPDVM